MQGGQILLGQNKLLLGPGGHYSEKAEDNRFRRA